MKLHGAEVSVPTVVPFTTKSTEEIVESVDGNVTVSVPVIADVGSEEFKAPKPVLSILESAVAQAILLGSDTLFVLTTASTL